MSGGKKLPERERGEERKSDPQVQRSSSVVAENDGRSTVRGGNLDVFGGLDAFDDDRKGGQGLKEGDEVRVRNGEM